MVKETLSQCSARANLIGHLSTENHRTVILTRHADKFSMQ